MTLPTNAAFLRLSKRADQITGLVWQTYGGPQGLMWMDAGAYCATQGLRLPSAKEAMTILDFTQSSSTGSLVDRTAFTKVGFYWTSSVILGQSASAWSVDLSDGSMAIDNYYGSATSAAAACVEDPGAGSAVSVIATQPRTPAIDKATCGAKQPMKPNFSKIWAAFPDHV